MGLTIKTANSNSPWASGGLIIGRIFASEIWGRGVIFGRAFFFFWGGGGLLSEFYGM